MNGSDDQMVGHKCAASNLLKKCHFGVSIMYLVSLIDHPDFLFFLNDLPDFLAGFC